MDKKCVMLIDDNPDDNFFHERVLKKNKIAEIVLSYDSAIEALEFFKNDIYTRASFPNLIFLDINMPGMNGWEFIEEIQRFHFELYQNLRIVILSNSNNPEDQNRAFSYKIVEDYYSKPLSIENISKISI